LLPPQPTSTTNGPVPEPEDGPVSEPEHGAPAGSPQDLEEEAGQQGAFNEETGEINWDCPCLGGMAHGPCGEQFREAFSCFVFSKEEPKGMDCIDKFKYVGRSKVYMDRG
jgi:intermembrane space import and assembly protein 40